MARKIFALALVCMTLFAMFSAKAYATSDDIIGTEDEDEVIAAAPGVAVEAPSAGGPTDSMTAYGPSAYAEGPSSGSAALKVSALGAMGAAGVAAFFY